jgi:hypothetical protein
MQRRETPSLINTWVRLIISGAFIFGMALPRILISETLWNGWALPFDGLGFAVLYYYWTCIDIAPLFMWNKDAPTCKHCGYHTVGDIPPTCTHCKATGDSPDPKAGDTRHCHMCARCSVDRLYHCLFIGRCVDARNAVPYIRFILWAHGALWVWAVCFAFNGVHAYNMARPSMPFAYLTLFWVAMWITFVKMLWRLQKVLAKDFPQYFRLARLL